MLFVCEKSRTVKIWISDEDFQTDKREVGYDILEVSNDEVKPVSEMNGDNQKLVIFDDFVCEKNQAPLID